MKTESREKVRSNGGESGLLDHPKTRTLNSLAKVSLRRPAQLAPVQKTTMEAGVSIDETACGYEFEVVRPRIQEGRNTARNVARLIVDEAFLYIHNQECALRCSESLIRHVYNLSMNPASRQDGQAYEPRLDQALTALRSELITDNQAFALNEASEPRVSRAIEWLLANRTDQGWWAYRSPTVTSLACLAIARWRPGEAEHLLKESAEWLLGLAEADTLETPWESAIMLRTLAVLDYGTTPEAVSLRGRLLELPIDASWARRPHHAAQIVSALAVCRVDAEMVADWSNCVREHVPPDTDPYILGQAVYALAVHTSVSREELAPHTEALSKFVKESSCTTSSFLQYTSALLALGALEDHSESVGRALDKLFSAGYRRDGSWYHDPLFSSWALLALSETRSARRVIIELPTFNSAFDQARRRYEDLSASLQVQVLDATKKHHLAALLAALLVSNVWALLVVALLWNRTQSVAISSILVGLLLIPLPILIARLREALRS